VVEAAEAVEEEVDLGVDEVAIGWSCMLQSVPIAVAIVKSLFDLQATNLFTAATVLKRKRAEAETGGRDRGRDRDFGGDRGRGRDRGSDRQMYKVICDSCGDRCEVPFKPSGDKPVLCSNCFAGNTGGGSGGRRSEQSSEKHDEILAKLDKIINLLQRTNPVKEITVMKSKKEEKAKEAKEAKPAKTTKKKTTAKKTTKKKAAKKATKAKKK